MEAYVLHFVCPWMAYFSVPDRLSLDSILMCFEQKAEKLETLHVWGLVVASWLGVSLMYIWLSWSWKGLDTDSIPPWQYSLFIRRNNKAIQERSEITCFLEVQL